MALYKPAHSNVYQVRFQMKGRKFRKSTGETDINRARSFEIAYKKECRLNFLNKVKDSTKVHKALDSFLRTKEGSDNYKNYEKSVNVLKAFFFSQQSLEDITFDQCEELADDLKKAGYANATI